MQLVNQQNFQVCTSRASSAASISTGVLRDSPRNGQDEVGKISVKSLRRFRSDFDQASNCKLQGQSLGTVQTRTSALQFAQFTETKFVSKFAQGIKNLYLLCKGRAVGKGQLVSEIVEVCFCLQARLLLWLHQVSQGRRPILKTEENGETFERFESEKIY